MTLKKIIQTRITLLASLLVVIFLAACQDVEEPTELAATLETTIRETVQPEEMEEPAAEPTEPPPTEVPPTPEPTAEPAPAYEPVFETVECWFDTPADVPVDCGYLVVPEDRSKPDGRTVRLATAIFRAPGGSPEPDPIIHLHGGPAGAPILSFQFGEYAGYAALTATNRDVIVFDQRGSGLSEPNLQCPEYVEANIDLFDLEINGEQVTHSEAQRIVLDAALECEARLMEIVDLNMYTTFESAHDVNDMRLALGYGLINLHGESYGTELAQAVVNAYPDTIRSVVLDAVEAPTDVYDVWPIATGSSINQTIADCAADQACNAAFPNLHEVLMDTLNRLDESPVVIKGLNRLTGEEVPVVLDSVAVETILWRFSYGSHNLALIPQLIYEISEGNYDTAASIYGGIALAIQFTEWGTFFSINCNAQLPFSDLEQFEANAENYPVVKGFFLDGTILGQFVYALCEEWDSGIAPDPRDTFETDLPTLVIGGNNDPATPPQSPVDIMAGLTNGFGPYIFPGMGHVVSLTDYECPVSVTLSFIIDPATEPETSCMNEMAIDFAIPGEADEVTLEPYTNEEAGFTTVIPTGWQEVQPGVYTRGNLAVDPTIFGQLAAPTAESEAVLGQILANLGVEELPDTPVKTLDSESLTWPIYLVTGDPTVAVALAGNGDTTYIIIMRTASGEFDGLVDTLMVPAILALTPAE